MVGFTDKILLNIEEFEKKINELNEIFNIPDFAQTPEDDALRLTKAELFIQDTDASVIDVVKLLSYSLLSGEYILNSNLKDTLNSIEEKVKTFINNTDFLPHDIQPKIFEYSSSLSIVVEGYKILIRDIANKYSEERVEFLFSQNNQFENSIKESNLSDKIDGVIDYFFLLLAVSHIDHFPSNENEYITNLFELEKKIKNLKIQEYNTITKNVLTKIKFLKHKWKARKVSENPNSHLYLDDGDIKFVEDFNEENSKLKEWTEIIETQYELISRNWVFILESRIKPYKNKSLKELKILEIHQLIKYYKDVKPDYVKLKQISKHLSENINSSANRYDNYSSIISSNYSLNNTFSLFLSQHSDFETIKSKYLEIKNKIRGEVNNFFLEYKYLEYAASYLLDKINEDDKIKYIEKYDDIIKNHCKVEIESYSINKDWSKSNYNYIFILPFEECLVPCSNIESLDNIFYASSFVLPPSNNKMEKDYLKIKEDFDKINLYINTGKYFKNEIEKIESLNSELDKKDFKSIEIISIFTAIITFVLSSIPAYRFIHSVWESLLFMLSLATALAIFITLIFFSTRNLYQKWQSYIPVIILLIICCFGYKNLTDKEKEKKQIDVITNKKIDSISAIKIDSIIRVKEYKNKVKSNPI